MGRQESEGSRHYPGRGRKAGRRTRAGRWQRPGRNHQFYLASRTFAQTNPELVDIVIEELAKVDEWGSKNLKDVAAILSVQTGLEPAIVELAAKRYSYGVKPVTPEVIREQQKIADVFASLKLIPKPIVVKDALLTAK